MNKKAWCTCRVVVLPNKPIAVLTSSLPSPSSLLKLPNHSYDYRLNWLHLVLLPLLSTTFLEKEVSLPMLTGESLFTFFAPLAYAYHYLMKLIKWNFWILKKQNNFSYLWKFEPDIPNSFGETLFEKPPNLQRMYELINVLPPSNFVVFNCCYFLCYWLQRAETCTNSIS